MDRKEWMERTEDQGKKPGMVGIDDLIGEIHDTEAPDLPGFMDEEQQERIEARIMAGILELQEKEESLGKESNLFLHGKEECGEDGGKNYRRKRKKRYFVMALAAVLLMGLCLSVFASTNPDWDVEILQFMGLDGSETFQLDSGEVEIHVYDVWDEIKIMAVSSIGDRNSVCIRIETDYELPEGFHEETDYIMPRDYSLNIYDKKGQIKKYGSTMGFMNLDGKLGYMIYITGCEGINSSKISLKFKDFYLHHDLGNEEGEKEYELLFSGEWELTWKYAYKSSTKRYRMLKPIEMEGDHFLITKIDVSPLSVYIKGFRMPMERKNGHVEFTIDRINYKDGTSLDVGGWSSAGNRDGIWIDTFLGTTEMKATIDVENVKSILIGGNEIYLK